MCLQCPRWDQSSLSSSQLNMTHPPLISQVQGNNSNNNIDKIKEMVAIYEAAQLYELLIAFRSRGKKHSSTTGMPKTNAEENAVWSSCFYFNCGECHHCPEGNLDAGMQSRLMGEDSDGDLYVWRLGVKPMHLLILFAEDCSLCYLHLRLAIHWEKWVTVTMWYLATGFRYNTVSHLFGISTEQSRSTQWPISTHVGVVCGLTSKLHLHLC